MLGSINGKKFADMFKMRGRNTQNERSVVEALHLQRKGTPSVFERYARAEEGSGSVFGIFAFCITLILAGIGVDVIRLEAQRADMQSAVDNAVLAAANLQQTADPETVVRDYLDKKGMGHIVSDVVIETAGASGRRVTAEVTANMQTLFLFWTGLDEFGVSSRAVAESGMSNLEISMVLDISGSMGTTKLNNLKTAASSFATTIYNNSAPGHASVNVVPYNMQVTAGNTILGALNMDAAVHDESHCITFRDSEFDTVPLQVETDDPNATEYMQSLIFNRDDTNILMAASALRTNIPALSIALLRSRPFMIAPKM